MNLSNGSIHQLGRERKGEIPYGALGVTQLAGATLAGNDAAPASLNRIGSGLTPSDYAALEARWIDRALADCAHLRRADSLTGYEIMGRSNGNCAGIIIPYLLPGSDQVREYRLRRDQPDLECDSAGELRARQKYLSPPGRSNMLYFVPGTGPALLDDVELPIIVADGEFKTLALWRLAHHGSSHEPRFLPLGVSGVYGWRGTIGKMVGLDGSRLDVKGAIKDLDWITWDRRRVILAFGTDPANPELARVARSELAAHLRGRGALVGFLEWNPAQGKGIDDHLAQVGAEVVLDAIAHLDFADSAWKKDLLRTKPSMNITEGRILPVFANAIAAFRQAPEWNGVLAFNEFAFGTVTLKSTPWGVVPKGEWTDQEDRLAAEWLQKQGILVSVEVAGQAVQTAARDRPFHPVKSHFAGTSMGRRTTD